MRGVGAGADVFGGGEVGEGVEGWDEGEILSVFEGGWGSLDG